MGWGKSPAVAGSTPRPGVLAAALDVQLEVKELSNTEQPLLEFSFIMSPALSVKPQLYVREK